MKTKIYLFICFFLLIAIVVSAKGKLEIISTSYPSDSSSASFIYYHAYSGQTFSISVYVSDVEPLGMYIGPADSIEWFLDGVPDGTTYGSQVRVFSASGIYSATGYWGGWFYFLQRTINFTYWNAMGLVQPDNSFLLSLNCRGEKNNFEIPSTKQEYLLDIYDLQGRLMLSKNLPPNNAEYSIDLPDWICGIYILTLRDAEHKYSRKFFIPGEN